MQKDTQAFVPEDNYLSGKTVLVTGAGDGIGKAVALAYARYGATVILLGRTSSKLEAVYDQILAAGGPESIIHPMDLASASDEDYRQLGDSVSEQCGSLDGLVHCAAILGPRSPIQFYPQESWLKVMQVNVNAAFALTKALLPALQNAASASVIFTSSSVGRTGRAYWGAYSVSKFATEGMMQVLADELRLTSHIRVNSIDPGGTRSNMRKEAYPAEDPQTLPSPEDRLPLYLFLMHPASEGRTGEALKA